MEKKREKEIRCKEEVGGKGSTEDSEFKTNQKEHSSMGPISSPVSPVSSPVSPVLSPMSPVSSPMSPVSFPVSPLLSAGDQVQATLPSSPPPRQSGYLHYVIGEIYLLYM